MSADDPGLAARLTELGLSKNDAGNVALARALDLAELLKAVLMRQAGGGPVVLSREELKEVDGLYLIDHPELDDNGQPVIRLELSSFKEWP